MQMDSPPPYSAGGGGRVRRFSTSRLGWGIGGGGGGGGSSSEETLLLPGRQRSLSTAGMPPHHYYQSLPEVTVLLADTEAAADHPLEAGHQGYPQGYPQGYAQDYPQGYAHGRTPWKDMGSSLGASHTRKDSLSARLVSRESSSTPILRYTALPQLIQSRSLIDSSRTCSYLQTY